MKIVELDNMILDAIKKSNTLRIAILTGKWEEIVGKVHKISEVVGIKDMVLYVRVESSTYLHYMNMKKFEYIDKINKYFQGEYIKNIIFKIGKINIENKFEIEKLNNEYEEKLKDRRVIPKTYKVESMSLEDSIEYLSNLSRKREEYLLGEGYSKCKECGSIFLGKRDLCDRCMGIPIQTVINKN